jgi:ATP-dependent protease Clp ATPase subunit
MFEAPSQSNVRRVTIEAETITSHAPAMMLARPETHETQEVDFDESA